MKKRLFSAILIFAFCQYYVYGQSSQSWVFLTYTQEISKKFDFLFDAQVRSNNPIKNTSAILLRGAVAYKINPKNFIALGYAYKGDWIEDENGKEYTFENRIYEQYQHDFKWDKMEWSFRTRVEQRFLTEEDTKFSIRGRAFLSAQYPLIANIDFSEGFFIGLQNEIFLNLYKKENVNGHFFDQNRPYVSLGYRFNKKIETTFDYGLISNQGPIERDLENVYRISLTLNL